ncbi:MAG: histidinol-phosphate aminotransferase family protein [Sphingobacteriia bacterium]|nr:MAG: histidinol-phosphate aminotransferase family protein [Sphingobacteriia bacterium]
MAKSVNRRDWLKYSSLATLGLGFRLPVMGNEEGILKSYGAEKGLVNLSSNENPYGISPKAKEAILQLIGESHRYQYNIASLQSFKKELAKKYGVEENQVLLTPGSGEALGLLPRVYNKGNLVTAYPTFGILPTAAKKIGTKVIEVPLNAEKAHDLNAMQKAITNETSLVYICNPANPSSTIVSPSSLKSFCIEASKNAVVAVDEAYIDYLDAPDNESMIGLIEKHPNVMVIGTFSKIHAMAGLRIGFVIASAAHIKTMSDNYFVRTQFAMSVLSMTAAQASLNDSEHHKISKQKNEVARKYGYEELKKLNIQCIPSYTNFLFFPLGKYPGNFAEDMLKQNIFLRSDTYAGEKWARASVGTLDEMKQFISIMKKDWKS